MKYRKFSDLGWNVSEIGLGCWGIGGNWDDVRDDEAQKVLFKDRINNKDIFYGNSKKIIDELLFKLKKDNFFLVK